MAYTRKTKKQNEWMAVDKMSGFSVIGSRERFSISFEPFDGMLIAIHGCRVVSGKNGDFISFPAWKDKEGKEWPHIPLAKMIGWIWDNYLN